MTGHERAVRIGDWLSNVGQWCTAIVFILLCALSGSVLGVTALLGILDMIGRN